MAAKFGDNLAYLKGMGKVIKFTKVPRNVYQLKEFSDAVDHYVIQAFTRGSSIPDIAGILANRLGEVLRISDETMKEKLRKFCFDLATKKSEEVTTLESE